MADCGSPKGITTVFAIKWPLHDWLRRWMMDGSIIHLAVHAGYYWPCTPPCTVPSVYRPWVHRAVPSGSVPLLHTVPALACSSRSGQLSDIDVQRHLSLANTAVVQRWSTTTGAGTYRPNTKRNTIGTHRPWTDSTPVVHCDRLINPCDNGQNRDIP